MNENRSARSVGTQLDPQATCRISVLSNRASPVKSKFKNQSRMDIEENSSGDDQTLRPHSRQDQARKSISRKKKPRKNLDLIDDEEE